MTAIVIRAIPIGRAAADEVAADAGGRDVPLAEVRAVAEQADRREEAAKAARKELDERVAGVIEAGADKAMVYAGLEIPTPLLNKVSGLFLGKLYDALGKRIVDAALTHPPLALAASADGLRRLDRAIRRGFSRQIADPALASHAVAQSQDAVMTVVGTIRDRPPSVNPIDPPIERRELRY